MSTSLATAAPSPAPSKKRRHADDAARRSSKKQKRIDTPNGSAEAQPARAVPEIAQIEAVGDDREIGTDAAALNGESSGKKKRKDKLRTATVTDTVPQPLDTYSMGQAGKRKAEKLRESPLPAAVGSSMGREKRTTANTKAQPQAVGALSENDGIHTAKPTSSPLRTRHKTQVAISEADSSPFYHQTCSFYLPLSPVAMSSPLEGLCAEHISPLLLTYFEPVKGIVLAYSEPRLTNDPRAAQHHGQEVLAQSIDEYGVVFVWLRVDMLVLRPDPGVEIEGQVTVQSEGHIGLICWNLFNANIAADQLPKSWRWASGDVRDKNGLAADQASDDTTEVRGQRDMGGHYIDGDGQPVEGLVKFRAVDFEVLNSFGKDKSFMSIQGTMREESSQKGRENGRSPWLRKRREVLPRAHAESAVTGGQNGNSNADSESNDASSSNTSSDIEDTARGTARAALGSDDKHLSDSS